MVAPYVARDCELRDSPAHLTGAPVRDRTGHDRRHVAVVRMGYEMSGIKVTVETVIETGVLDDVVETGGYAYWGDAEIEDRGSRDERAWRVTIREELRDTNGVTHRDPLVTYDSMARALALMSTGKTRDHEYREVAINDYQARAATELLFSPSEADWDADTADMMLQLAAFGRVLFG